MAFKLQGTPVKGDIKAVAANMDTVMPVKGSVVQVKPKSDKKKK